MTKPTRKNWHTLWVLDAPSRRAQHLPSGVTFYLTAAPEHPVIGPRDEETLWAWLASNNGGRADEKKRNAEQYAALCRQSWALLEYHDCITRERGPRPAKPAANAI